MAIEPENQSTSEENGVSLFVSMGTTVLVSGSANATFEQIASELAKTLGDKAEAIEGEADNKETP